MTWLKLSDDFSDDCARLGLSDAAFRTHVEGLIWTMRRETGGYLDAIDVRRCIETTDTAAAVAELVAVGFWRTEGDGWRVVHGMEHQPEPDVLTARRDSTAERVRKHRRKQAGVTGHASGHAPGNAGGNASRNVVTGAVTERVTRDGTGRVSSSPLPEVKERALASLTAHHDDLPVVRPKRSEGQSLPERSDGARSTATREPEGGPGGTITDARSARRAERAAARAAQPDRHICGAVKRDGTLCRTSLPPEQELCFWHDRERREARRICGVPTLGTGEPCQSAPLEGSDRCGAPHRLPVTQP